MVLQYHFLSPDNVCDILHANLTVFVTRIFLPCDFFVELKAKKSQQILLVLFCDLRVAVLKYFQYFSNIIQYLFRSLFNIFLISMETTAKNSKILNWNEDILNNKACVICGQSSPALNNSANNSNNNSKYKSVVVFACRCINIDCLHAIHCTCVNNAPLTKNFLSTQDKGQFLLVICNNSNNKNNNRNIYKSELVGASNRSLNPPKLSLFGTLERPNNSNTRRLRIVCFKYEFQDSQDSQDNRASVSSHIRSTAAQTIILHSVLGGNQIGSNNNGSIVNNPNSFCELLSPQQQLSAALANRLQSPSYVYVVFFICSCFLVVLFVAISVDTFLFLFLLLSFFVYLDNNTT